MRLNDLTRLFEMFFSFIFYKNTYLSLSQDFLSDIYAIRMVFRRLAVDALVFFLSRKKYP